MDISVEDFFLNSSLYKETPVASATDVKYIWNLLFSDSALDCYCIECGKESTFRSFGPQPEAPQGYLDYLIEKNIVEKKFVCTRDFNHQITFLFKYIDQNVIKIGQYPALAKIESQGIKHYRKVLGGNYHELARAVGLESHGVGIGSFVYLRRIFEGLIEEAHQASIAQPDWNEDEYSRSRMADKITLLKDHLPEFLVENKALYSILSKGIHELSEQECLDAFPVVKLGIELILDEKIKEIERVAKIREATKKIADLATKIK